VRVVKPVLAVLIALLALAALPGAARANAAAVLIDCQDGVLDERHSTRDLRQARDELQGDVAEYTSCSEVIGRALTPAAPDAAGGRTSAPGDVAAFTDESGLRRDASGVPVDDEGAQVDPETFAAPEQRADLAAARRGERIVPTAAGVRPGEAGAELPAPLVALVAVAALAALAAAAGALRRRPLRLRGRPA
jgi:hypothetical protein